MQLLKAQVEPSWSNVILIAMDFKVYGFPRMTLLIVMFCRSPFQFELSAFFKHLGLFYDPRQFALYLSDKQVQQWILCTRS